MKDAVCLYFKINAKVRNVCQFYSHCIPRRSSEFWLEWALLDLMHSPLTHRSVNQEHHHWSKVQSCWLRVVFAPHALPLGRFPSNPNHDSVLLWYCVCASAKAFCLFIWWISLSLKKGINFTYFFMWSLEKLLMNIVKPN